MTLPLLLLLLSTVLHHGTNAEEQHSNTLQQPAGKENNGVQDPQHEKVITVSGDGTVHSPDFPRTYPRNTVIVWRLVASEKNVQIQLKFDERFGLEDPEDGICKYDFIQIEEPTEGTVLGRWCGSQAVPANQVSTSNQIRIRFVSDKYFPAEPGFCIHFSLLAVTAPAAVLTPLLSMDALTEAVVGFNTAEEVLQYLEPHTWQLDMEDLYKPTWQVLGKAFFLHKKTRGLVDLNLLKEEARLYSCTPRNFSVSLREELSRTDSIFWPSCVLVKRCGGNCACCRHHCYNCQCVPTRVTKKYHEVLLLRYRSGGGRVQKSLTDIPLEHHEECDCVCRDDTD